MICICQSNILFTHQVKLELEVTLTPESEVSSTVTCNNPNNTSNSCENDQSMQRPIVSSSKNVNHVSTVVPPTTIVCLPTMTTRPIAITKQPMGKIQTTYINAVPANAITLANKQQFLNKNIQRVTHIQLPQQTAQITQAQVQNQVQSQTPQTQVQGQVQLQTKQTIVQQPQRAAIVASSSSLPYLQITSTAQPVRTVAGTITTTSQSQLNATRTARIPNRGGRGRGPVINRPPPGRVNIERSYQICQAVIQNSPNRHQLKAQLKPPPSMLATVTTAVTTNVSQTKSNATNTTAVIKRELAVTSTNRTVFKLRASPALAQRLQGQLTIPSLPQPTNGAPRIAFPKKQFVHRQPSPMLVRHVFTSNQGIPVSMAVLPTNATTGQQQIQRQTTYQNVINTNRTNNATINQGGQYILVQRAGVIAPENQNTPRASSAPPAQNQVRIKFDC